MSSDSSWDLLAEEAAAHEAFVEWALDRAETTIRKEGTPAFELFWDSGGPGAGAEEERVYQYRGEYFADFAEGGMLGPLTTLAEALEDRVRINEATQWIRIHEGSPEEVVRRFPVGPFRPGYRHLFALNDQPWVVVGETVRPAGEADYLYQFAMAWNDLRPTGFSRLLAADVIYQSDEVGESLQGFHAVERYLFQKIEAVRRSSPGGVVRAEVALLGPSGIDSGEGDPGTRERACVLLYQGSDPQPESLVLLQVADGRVHRIDARAVSRHANEVRPSGVFPSRGLM